MREGFSQTVNIACMSGVTGYNRDESEFTDIIICKWEMNGVDHYYNEAQATTDCRNIGYSELWSTEKISDYQTTPTNDQSLLKKYIDSSVCGR